MAIEESECLSIAPCPEVGLDVLVAIIAVMVVICGVAIFVRWLADRLR
jgi:hypothetical protein